MRKFDVLTAVAAPLIRANVDTDAIIPSREMKSVSKHGLAEGLFAGWRYKLLAQSLDLDDYGNHALVIDQKDLDRALKILEDIKHTLDAKVISYTPDVAVITVFGHHLREKPHIHGRMFSSMASAGIGSLAISTSLSSVSCVIKGEDVETVLQALSDTFEIPYEVKTRPKDY